MSELFHQIRPLLKPPGAGITMFSAGRDPLPLQKKIYSKSSEADVLKAWEKSFADLTHARAFVLGVPSDNGGGIRRGAAHGPFGVRDALLKKPKYLKWIKEREIIDLGDIFVNPHFLSDDMLSDSQIREARNAMYQGVASADSLPVAPLSQLEFVLKKVMSAYPSLHPFLIGGDHSVAWPLSKILIEKHGPSLGIVQIDAHTDLLPSRLGVKICFGTWSYHANELMGRKGRLVQVGIRQTKHPRSHWEESLNVRQFWANDIKQPTEKRVMQDLVLHLKSTGVKHVYFTNDIDGTDSRFAPATGTPAAKGLTPKFVENLISVLKSQFKLVASDIMEVAPDLGPTPRDRALTCELAADYAVKCLEK
jgi:arginase family enzyme